MSSSIPYIKYPVDWTGTASTNRVNREPRTIGANSQRAFIPDGGPFYVDSLVVYNAVTGLPLIKHQQYKVLHPLEEPTIRAGKPIACVIYIEDRTVGTEVLYDCQLVGGEFSWATTVIAQALETINLDSRPVYWGDLLDLPTSFRPTPHLHDAGDTYGWEYILLELERIRRAILLGDVESHEELRRQYMWLINELRAEVEAMERTLDDHISNTNNPHGTTKAHIGLPLVENFPPANEEEARLATAMNRYMTPGTSRILVEELILPPLNAHINNNENPHGTTAAQVGAYTIGETNARLDEKLGKTETAVDSTKFAGLELLEAYNHFRANLPAENITSGVMKTPRVGAGNGTPQHVLVGGADTPSWMNFETLISQYMAQNNVGQIYYAGYVTDAGDKSYGLSIVANLYIDPIRYPPGTIVIYKGSYVYAVYVGNGAVNRTAYYTGMALKTAGGGWELIL